MSLFFNDTVPTDIYTLSLHVALPIFFFFNDTATTEIYTLSLHDALPIWARCLPAPSSAHCPCLAHRQCRSEEHTSELQSLRHLVCRLLLEKKNQSRFLSQVRYNMSTILIVLLVLLLLGGGGWGYSRWLFFNDSGTTEIFSFSLLILLPF